MSLCVCGKFAGSKSIGTFWWLLHGGKHLCDHQQDTTGRLAQGRAVGVIHKEAKLSWVPEYVQYQKLQKR